MSKIKDQLNRRQQRFQDRVSAEAQETFNIIAGRVLNAIIHSEDPEGEETTKAIDLSLRQWNVYCSAKNLVPQAKEAMTKYVQNLLEEFKQNATQPNIS
jgi:hypothetical protein